MIDDNLFEVAIFESTQCITFDKSIDLKKEKKLCSLLLKIGPI